MTEWQPIETAPKDGRILIASDTYVCIGVWSDKHKCFTDEHDGLDRFYSVDGWMHLPEPPK